MYTMFSLFFNIIAELPHQLCIFGDFFIWCILNALQREGSLQVWQGFSEGIRNFSSFPVDYNKLNAVFDATELNPLE